MLHLSCAYILPVIRHICQRCAARWVCGSRWNPTNRTWTKSSEFCLQELKWPSLRQVRRNYVSIIISFVHDILHKPVSISFKDHFHFFHQLYLIPSSDSHYIITIYHQSLSLFFFINSPFLWNSIQLKIKIIVCRRAFYRTRDVSDTSSC